MSKKLRIFLGLSEISGLYQGLEAGFKQLGLNVTRVDLGCHPYKYNETPQSFLIKKFQYSIQKSLTGFFIKKAFWKIVSLICKLLLFLQVFYNHDVFIFSYGTSFFRLKELKILKYFKKKIIFQFHGSDSRPPFMDGTLIPHYDTAAIANMTVKKKQQIETINRYADAIIDIPPMGLFHEKPFINWLHIGLTVNITTPPLNKNNTINSVIKILHAPSNRLAKGTQRIEQCIDQLKQKGYCVELIEIHNQPNQKVKEALAECDFVIDQLYSDYPMPGFATESAWFSKPTIICGYAVDLWNSLLSEEKMPPSYYCHPDDLIKAVKLFCDDHVFKFNLGQKAFEFVSKKWVPIEVASRYLQIIQEASIPGWFCYPNEISYLHGCGIEEMALKKFLNKFISLHGLSALQLHDKPDLEKKFQEFAGGEYAD